MQSMIKRVKPMNKGLHIAFDPIRQRWLLLWRDQVLESFRTKCEAHHERDMLLGRAETNTRPFAAKTLVKRHN